MDTGQLPVLELEGPPRERGRAYGEAMRAKIAEVRAIYLDYLGDYFAMGPAEFLAGFSRHTNFLPAIRAFAPHLLEEVQGLAEGAGIDEETALSMQLVDEEWQYGFLHHDPARPRNKCTSFGVVGSDVTWAGQNMDIPPIFDGYQVLMRVRDPAREGTALVFAYAGMVGLNGMNDAPFGLCCNAVNQLTPSAAGLPVAFIVRLLLEQRSFAGAEALLRSVPHASGQNYLLAAPGRVGSFECSARDVIECPQTAEGRVCHTNHALANADRSAFDERTAQLPSGDRPTFLNSRQRLASINARVGRMQAGTLADFKAALSAKDDPANPVSRTELDVNGSAIGFTAGSMIYELGATPRLHLASGPPCSTPWHTIGFA